MSKLRYNILPYNCSIGSNRTNCLRVKYTRRFELKMKICYNLSFNFIFMQPMNIRANRVQINTEGTKFILCDFWMNANLNLRWAETKLLRRFHFILFVGYSLDANRFFYFHDNSFILQIQFNLIQLHQQYCILSFIL